MEDRPDSSDHGDHDDPKLIIRQLTDESSVRSTGSEETSAMSAAPPPRRSARLHQPGAGASAVSTRGSEEASINTVVPDNGSHSSSESVSPLPDSRSGVHSEPTLMANPQGDTHIPSLTGSPQDTTHPTATDTPTVGAIQPSLPEPSQSTANPAPTPGSDTHPDTRPAADLHTPPESDAHSAPPPDSSRPGAPHEASPHDVDPPTDQPQTSAVNLDHGSSRIPPC